MKKLTNLNFLFILHNHLKLTLNGLWEKKILNLNPAEPSVHMQTTISAKLTKPNLEKLNDVIGNMITKIKSYTQSTD